MTPNPYQQYRATRVETASPVDQVLMLYQGVTRFTQRAIMATEQGNVEDAHNSFVRAQDIVAHLIGSLNFDDGGQIARGLVALYDYAYRRLVEANSRKSVTPAAEVVRIFRELASAWQELAGSHPRRLTAAPLATLRAAS